MLGSPSLLPLPSLQTVTSSVNCSQWYQVLQGDSCPTIWNAANLSMIAFFELNPGIQVRMRWDGMGWDGMGWDGMGCDAMACCWVVLLACDLSWMHAC